MAKKLTKPKKPMSLLQLLKQEVNVETLLESVYIDEDKLIDAALEQPDLMVLAGRFRVQRMHVRVKLETQLKLVQAQAGLRLRRIKDGQGRKEFTEGAVKERIELDPVVRKVQRKLNRAIALEELSKNLMEVFRTRSDSLRTIVASGKISVHAMELEILRGNSKMAKTIQGVRERWRSNNS